MSYRFLLTPRWLAFHALMLGLIVLMVNFGFWQLGRYREVHATNEAVAARTLEPAVPVGAILDEPPDTIEWRTVLLEGSYDVTEQVLVRNRSYQGSGGLHVITPLRLADGGAVLVNRGWIPLQLAASPPPPPDGPVTVSARVRAGSSAAAWAPAILPRATWWKWRGWTSPGCSSRRPYELAPFYVEPPRRPRRRRHLPGARAGPRLR
jgi:cytochrome oxidase assembly protein ShyY1